jgi:hypothetical protein
MNLFLPIIKPYKCIKKILFQNLLFTVQGFVFNKIIAGAPNWLTVMKIVPIGFFL